MQTRQPIFDFIKAIAAFMVVCIHFRFPDSLNAFVLPITRWAIPFFFVASGYLLSRRSIDASVIKRSLRKIFFILLNAALFYILFLSILSYFSGWSLIEFPDLKNLPASILLNYSLAFLGGHLWYLEAYLWVLLILGMAVRLKVFDRLVYLMPLLLGCCIVYNYLVVLCGDMLRAVHLPDTVDVTRNFLFVGLPFFLLGRFLQQHEQAICSYRFRQSTLLGLLAGCFVLNILEAHFVGIMELYVGSVCEVVLIMMLGIRMEGKSLHTDVEKIGDRHSLNIYIYHMALLPFFDKGLDLIGWDTLRYLNPFLLFGATLCFSVFVNRLKATVRRRKLFVSIRS